MNGQSKSQFIAELMRAELPDVLKNCEDVVQLYRSWHYENGNKWKEFDYITSMNIEVRYQAWLMD